MKKTWGWIIGVVLVVAIVFYIIWNNISATPAPSATNTNPNGGTNGSAGTTGGTTTGTSTVGGGNGNTGGTTAAGYNDGTYTGSVADAVYGQLQVSVTISGGKITAVSWPVYPNSPGHTSQVSASALPQLEQEAIASQSANVSVVSGATQDSEAFQESLTVALAKAKS